MKTNYSEEEWRLIAAIPQFVSYTVAGAGFSGVVGTAKEALASVQAMMAGLEDYPENGLIGSIAPDPNDMEAAKKTSLANKAYLEQLKTEHKVETSEEMSDIILKEIYHVLAIVDERELEKTAVEFRHWIYQIGHKVASAAKEGGFLGIGGKRISEDEAKFLVSLRVVLALDDNPL